MTTPKKTPVPDMPGFSRNENGNLEFDPFSAPNKPIVRCWSIYYSNYPIVFGFSPSSPQVKAFLAENPKTEFRFCTIAENETHGANVTYHCLPHRYEIEIVEVEFFDKNGAYLGTFPQEKLPDSLLSTIESAVALHIIPLVEFHG